MADQIAKYFYYFLFFRWARGHTANLKGPVCYLSARHRPSQVSATPQQICVITATFSHFPDNVLHPLNPSFHCLLLSLLAFSCFCGTRPHLLLSSFPSLSFIHLLTRLYLHLLSLNPLSYPSKSFSSHFAPILYQSSSIFPLSPLLPLSSKPPHPILQCSSHIWKCWILTSACRSSDPWSN